MLAILVLTERSQSILPEFSANDADRLQRFVLCARDNPNLLFILDVGTLAGVQYLVSEVLDGNLA